MNEHVAGRANLDPAIRTADCAERLHAAELVLRGQSGNRLVHEYPVNEVEQVDRVNECWAAIPRLTDIYEKLRQRLSEQGFHA
ncbi:MAG: hypothetical protein EOP67_76985 [Sphingomonas sp.]|nr:MAG: hypothetical protein EOP67_76985 [Sphingomonas sp.]